MMDVPGVLMESVKKLDCWKKIGRSLSNSILKKEVYIICFGFIFCRVAFYGIKLLLLLSNCNNSVDFTPFLHVESISDRNGSEIRKTDRFKNYKNTFFFKSRRSSITLYYTLIHI